MEYNDIKELKGKTLTGIEVEKESDDYILFATDSGEIYKMYHEQDCCEAVYIKDIVGDFEDLIGNPLIMAQEASQEGDGEDNYGTQTFTFYRFATIKGTVDIAWYGSSNGYYSESVDIEKVN